MADRPFPLAAPKNRPRAAFPPARVAAYLFVSTLVLNFLLDWPGLAS